MFSPVKESMAMTQPCLDGQRQDRHSSNLGYVRDDSPFGGKAPPALCFIIHEIEAASIPYNI